MTLVAEPQGGEGMAAAGDLVVLARSVEARIRAHHARLDAARERHDARWNRALARLVAQDARALRQRTETTLRVRRTLDGPVAWFVLGGTLGSRPVWATWRRGLLTGDRELLERAQYLVDHGAVFTSEDATMHVEATLAGPPASVMLTLAHACDRVGHIDHGPPTNIGLCPGGAGPDMAAGR